MKTALLKSVSSASAILVALVGTACAVDLVDPDTVCRWKYPGGRWVPICS